MRIEIKKKPPHYVGRDEDKREVFLSQDLQAYTSLTLWILAHLLRCDKLSCTHVCVNAYQFGLQKKAPRESRASPTGRYDTKCCVVPFITANLLQF